MAKLFSAHVITLDKTVFEGKVSSLIAPGESGYFGVLANHAPFIASLRPGKITMRESSGKTSFITSTAGGLFKVSNNTAVFLLDSVN